MLNLIVNITFLIRIRRILSGLKLQIFMVIEIPGHLLISLHTSRWFGNSAQLLNQIVWIKGLTSANTHTHIKNFFYFKKIFHFHSCRTRKGFLPFLKDLQEWPEKTGYKLESLGLKRLRGGHEPSDFASGEMVGPLKPTRTHLGAKFSTGRRSLILFKGISTFNWERKFQKMSFVMKTFLLSAEKVNRIFK